MRERLAVAAVALAAAWSAAIPSAAAQSDGLGIVTALRGSATVSRAATSAPLYLKDSVLERDRIATAEKSLVRVLLGGRAIVTVRELSELTLAERASTLSLELSCGRMALSVARQLMGSGETVAVHTPNAVAYMRGSVAVVDVGPAAPGASVESVFSVLSGPAEVAAGGASVQVASRQRVRVAGVAIGPVEDLTGEEVDILASALTSIELQHPDAASELFRAHGTLLGADEDSVRSSLPDVGH
jgi:hypothetical protein